MRSLLALCLLASACTNPRNMGSACSESCKKCEKGVCKDCVAGKNFCQGEFVLECLADGTVGQTVKSCDSANHQMCKDGDCQSPCDVAAATRSYIGCDYWPTTLLNPQLNPYFDFAVAVANPARVGDVVQSAPAHVVVKLGSDVVAEKDVDPGQVETILLPWVDSVSQNQSAAYSVLAEDGAYHLVSNLPVTVYQFSPLQFEKPQTNDCVDPNPMGAGTCHSYTNDASILLPSTALGGEYLVVSRQTFVVEQKMPKSSNAIPGYFTVVATKDKTTVTVTSTAYTEPSGDIPEMKPGQKESFLLEKAGTVLQIISKKAKMPCAKMASDFQGNYCDLGPQYDLTGTHVAADKPIAVFGGHACAFVPYNKWACDHLEEQMFPLGTWGQKVAAVQTEPQIAGEANVFRILSGSDKNKISFEPQVYKDVTLDAGEWAEFQTLGGFVATGTGRIAVAQYTVGQNATQDFGVDVGDPDLGLGTPIEQWRSNYDFLTPATYTKSYVNVIAPVAAELTLDEKPVMGMLTGIGSTGLGFKRIELPAGAHNIKSNEKFGITVSGVANFTSYLYAGGLNLNEIEPQ